MGLRTCLVLWSEIRAVVRVKCLRECAVALDEREGLGPSAFFMAAGQRPLVLCHCWEHCATCLLCKRRASARLCYTGGLWVYLLKRRWGGMEWELVM